MCIGFGCVGFGLSRGDCWWGAHGPLLTGSLLARGAEPSLPSQQLHPWVTKNGEEPLPSEEEHCSVVEVTEEEVKNSVKLIPSWTTVVRG